MANTIDSVQQQHQPRFAAPRKQASNASSSLTSASMSARSSAVASVSGGAEASPRKSVAEMSRLRKLVSLSYYSGKVKGWLHREERDTIVCEEDEEALGGDAFADPDGVLSNPNSVASAFYASWLEEQAKAKAASGASVSTSSASTSSMSSAGSSSLSSSSSSSFAAPAASTSVSFAASGGASCATSSASAAFASASVAPSAYEPSKEQRWCTNCAKCFQRSLSRYDQFCGLDCRTAHRFRLAG